MGNAVNFILRKSARNFSHVIGRKGEMPKSPTGFVVEKFADGFENPHWMYITPNGDILVAESNSNHTFLEKVGGTIIANLEKNEVHGRPLGIVVTSDGSLLITDDVTNIIWRVRVVF